MEKVVIVDGCRTAVGSFGGTLKPLSAAELAVAVMKGSLVRTGIGGELVDEICFGQCRQNSDHSNIARYAALAAGIPERAAGTTVMCACASGMMAMRDAANTIAVGQNEGITELILREI